MTRRKKEFVMSKDDLCYKEPMDAICFYYDHVMKKV